MNPSLYLCEHLTLWAASDRVHGLTPVLHGSTHTSILSENSHHPPSISQTSSKCIKSNAKHKEKFTWIFLIIHGIFLHY